MAMFSLLDLRPTNFCSLPHHLSKPFNLLIFCYPHHCLCLALVAPKQIIFPNHSIFLSFATTIYHGPLNVSWTAVDNGQLYSSGRLWRCSITLPCIALPCIALPCFSRQIFGSLRHTLEDMSLKLR